ncbi:unnamed protein product, partial [Penicillium discolor]
MLTTTASDEPSSSTETNSGKTVGPTWPPAGTWMVNTPANANTPSATMSRAKTSSPRGRDATRRADRRASVRTSSPGPEDPVVMSADQPDVLQRRGDLGDVAVEELVELGAREEGIRPAPCLQLVLPGFGRLQLGDDALELRALGVADAARRDHAAPVGEHDVVSGVGDRVDVRQLRDRFLRRDGEGLHGAGLD